MSGKLLLFCLLLLLPLFDAKSQIPWIIGGSNTMQGQLPWVGNIVMNGSHYCGAALINSKWAVTAGHCSFDYRSNVQLSLDSTRIRFNSISGNGLMSPGGIEVGIKKFYPFPAYDINDYYAGFDICLIELATPVNSINPIPLPALADTSVLYLTGTSVKVAGWGLQDTFSFTSSNILKWCNTNVYDFALCNNLSVSRYGTNLSHDRFCAGFKSNQVQAGAAAGDSGGPIWKEDASGNRILLGVVSGGFSYTTLADMPGYFTKMALYINWADSIMGTSTTGIPKMNWTDDQIHVGTTSGHVSLSFGNLKVDQIEIGIYNMQGQKVYGSTFRNPSNNSMIINNDSLPAGLYLIRLSGNGFSFVKKLANAQ